MKCVLSDMINMLKLGFVPLTCCWVHRRGQAQALLAVYDNDALNRYCF